MSLTHCHGPVQLKLRADIKYLRRQSSDGQGEGGGDWSI